MNRTGRDEKETKGTLETRGVAGAGMDGERRVGVGRGGGEGEGQE